MTMTMKPTEMESAEPTTANNNNKKTAPTLSKRQRHAAGPNPSNTWQQQPRIKSAGARARAYIAYAGLADDEDDDAAGGDSKAPAASSGGGRKEKSSSSSSTNKAALLLDPQIDLNSPEVKFGRMLGGTDQRKRHTAVKLLRSYLTSRADFTKGGVGFSQLDFLKLWKGLWYTLYMADKAPVQDKLSKILAELMWCLAGTEEEDEYAGEVFLEMEGDDDCFGNDYDDEDDNEEEDDTHEGMEYGVFEDDDGDTMEIIEMGENSDDGEEEDDENNMDGDEENDYEDHCEDEDEDKDDYEDEEDEIDDEEQRIKDMNEKHCRGAHLVSLYISTFLCTMRREWGNVDKHRVDKFYTAVRLMISEAYKYMSKRNWNIGIIHLFNDAFYEEGLSAETLGLTNGLRYHLIDICIDELAKVNKDAEIPLTEATFLDCIEPFFVLAQRAMDKNVQKRVMDNVLLKFLNKYSFVSSVATDDNAEDDEKALIYDQVHVGTVSKFIFQIASDNETDERYRKSLYEMHKTYERKIKAAGRDVDDVEYCVEINNEVGKANEDEDCDDKNSNSDGMQSSVRGLSEENDNCVHQISNEEVGTTETTAPTTSEKKKRKKKKKGETVQEDEVVDEITNLGDGTAIDLSPMKSSSKKKRKNMENGNNDKGDEVQTSAPGSEKVEKRNITLITSKSSKKQKKKDDDTDTSLLVTSHVETPAQFTKKKKQKSPPSVDPRSMHSLDQISSPGSDDAGASPSRRVSFGATNHSKSHKASMKAVKTLEKERWDTRRTPEKSILRAKSSEKMKSKSRLTGQSSSRKKKGSV